MLIPLNGILIGLVFAGTVLVMARWHFGGRGAWRHYPAGRSVMGLLGLLAAVTLNATITTFAGDYPHKSEVYGVLYALLLVAIAQIGAAIITAQNERKKDDNED